MRDLPWDRVVSALEALGCVRFREDTWHVGMARGATVITYVPKTPMVPVAIQRRVLATFSFDVADFLRVLAPLP